MGQIHQDQEKDPNELSHAFWQLLQESIQEAIDSNSIAMSSFRMHGCTKCLARAVILVLCVIQIFTLLGYPLLFTSIRVQNSTQVILPGHQWIHSYRFVSADHHYCFVHDIQP